MLKDREGVLRHALSTSTLKQIIIVADDNRRKVNTYIKVGRESSINNRGTFLVAEEEHLGLSRVVTDEIINVGASDLDDSVSNVLISHLFELVGVKFRGGLDVVHGRNRCGRINNIRRVLRDALSGTNAAPLVAFDRADSEHFLVLDGKLLILTLVSLRVGF